MTSPASAPWHLFAAHQCCPFPFFMDRAAHGRISFAGSRPREQLVIERNGEARIWRGGSWHADPRDPVDCIDGFVGQSRSDAIDAPAWLDGSVLPRVVGYLSYELGEWTERHSQQAAIAMAKRRQSAAGIPLAVLSLYDGFDAWDPRSLSSAHVRFALQPSEGSSDGPAFPAPAVRARWTATTRADYRRGFDRIRSAIAAGEIYQANLSRRAVFPFDGSAAKTYAALRAVQPVPWGAFLDFGGFALLSNSPECFLSRRGDDVETRPIKGTRPRHSNTDADASARNDLQSDPKELAEHLMIVDLERNDLGRVARTGSVEVNHLANVESYATVHHMVTDVRAKLRPGTGVASLLRATFPGGSITGAPKIRAMEILREVEAAERGPYTGAIGCFNGGDELELSIAIRTAVTSGDRLVYSTGGGIVADSDPDREWEETEVKLAALVAALGAGRPVATSQQRHNGSNTSPSAFGIGAEVEPPATGRPALGRAGERS